MAVKIYSAPKGIREPQIDYVNFTHKQMEQEETRYINEVKQYIINSGYKGKNVGAIIQFPVADGYAQYMVVSMKPLQLMHLPLGDAWHYQYVNRLTASDIKKQIDSSKAMSKLFSSKKQ